MDKGIKIYFDKESDFLEILFEIKEGFFQETENNCNYSEGEIFI